METAIQLTLTELNENLREIYIEAYTQKEAADYIFRETAKELHQIFDPYQPDLTEHDFYYMEIGSAGIMRGYMAHPCSGELTLEKKLRMFLTMSLRAYHVPDDEIIRAIGFIESLDIRRISEQVIKRLFEALAMYFEFSLGDMEESENRLAENLKAKEKAREYTLTYGYISICKSLLIRLFLGGTGKVRIEREE